MIKRVEFNDFFFSFNKSMWSWLSTKSLLEFTVKKKIIKFREKKKKEKKETNMSDREAAVSWNQLIL